MAVINSDIPTILTLLSKISNICNLDCSFCIKTNREKRTLSIDEFKIILSKIKPYTKYLYFHVLGEPLLHKNINEFIDIASEDFFVNITTNGYLINNINTNKIRQINISLHSFDEKYNKSLNDYLNDLYNFSVNNKNTTYINYRLWTNSKYTNEIISYLENKYNTKIQVGVNNKLDKNVYLNFSSEFIWPDKATEKVDINTSCHALIDHIAILSDGTITACCLDASGKINFGNIFKDDLKDVFNNELFINMLEGFKYNKRIHPLCQKCNFIDKKNKN